MKKNFADIQNYERKKRRAEAGYFYHRQYNQIIVSREELYFQLEKADLLMKILLRALRLGTTIRNMIIGFLWRASNFGLSAVFLIRAAGSTKGKNIIKAKS